MVSVLLRSVAYWTTGGLGSPCSGLNLAKVPFERPTLILLKVGTDKIWVSIPCFRERVLISVASSPYVRACSLPKLGSQRPLHTIKVPLGKRRLFRVNPAFLLLLFGSQRPHTLDLCDRGAPSCAQSGPQRWKQLGLSSLTASFSRCGASCARLTFWHFSHYDAVIVSKRSEFIPNIVSVLSSAFVCT